MIIICSFLQLSITVRDSGQPQPLVTHGTLTVEIIDIDDNPPVFNQVLHYAWTKKLSAFSLIWDEYIQSTESIQEVYEEQILENLPAGTVVTVLSTDDEDTLIQNTRAFYSIIGMCQKYGDIYLCKAIKLDVHLFLCRL